MKKKWLLGPVLMGVLALGIIGSGGGAVFAQAAGPAVSSLASQAGHGVDHGAARDHGSDHVAPTGRTHDAVHGADHGANRDHGPDHTAP